MRLCTSPAPSACPANPDLENRPEWDNYIRSQWASELSLGFVVTDGHGTLASLWVDGSPVRGTVIRNVPPVLCPLQEGKGPTEFIFREASCSKGTPSSFLPEGWWAGGLGRATGLFLGSLVSSHFPRPETGHYRESAPKRVPSVETDHLPAASWTCSL